MSNDKATRLRDVRDAFRLALDKQLHTIDQLLQRSAVLLAAANVLAALLAVASTSSSTSWKQWTTRVAFAAVVISLIAGIIAVWPRRVSQEDLPGGLPVKSVDDYVAMAPEDFLRKQCDEAYITLTVGGYAKIIKFRRNVFRIQTVSLVVGGVLIAITSLVPAPATSQHHQPTGRHRTIGGTNKQSAKPEIPSIVPTPPWPVPSVPAPPLW